MHQADLSLDRIAAAHKQIDPVFLNSAQYVDELLSNRLGRRVLTKIETFNPLRSFKGRGADLLVGGLPPGSTAVCASGGGNFGQAVAYAARRHGMRADVFVPASTSPVKTERMAAFGAHVHTAAQDHQHEAKGFAEDAPGGVLIADGRDAAIAEGAGTIGIELLRTGGFGAIVLPVGDGALITGVARWIKAHAPEIRIVGVGTSSAPALVQSWRTGDVVTVEQRNSFAAGISIRRPYPEAVRRTRALVDDMVLVDDDELVAAMHLIAGTLGVLPEPAGAAGIAAIASGLVPEDTVATVITGANAELDIYAGAWSHGSARMGGARSI